MNWRTLISRISLLTFISFSMLMGTECSSDDPPGIIPFEGPFYFGSDLSFANQILDHGGIYKDEGVEGNPFKILHDHGNNLVRLRIWHNPVWTMEVYGASGTQPYNDLKDVERSITEAKNLGMDVLLDFHYSDIWADPGNQKIPAAWQDIAELSVLQDSVYNYTFKVLSYLDSKGLLPDLVQLGNETNCGMLYTDAPVNFPAANVCNGQWSALRSILNSAVDAVHDVSEDTKVILHIADPKNVQWWFDNLLDGANVDFDIIGISYYPLWHTTVSLPNLSQQISLFRTRYGKDVMIVETAYPWTTESDDSYTNLFGSQTPLTGFPYTQKGQEDMMKTLTQEVIDGGGIGVIYWEPDWISSQMKDLWGTGSAWENTALFDFEGNTTQGIGYMQHIYKSK